MGKRVYITEYEQLGEDRVGSVVCGGCGWEVTAPPDSLPPHPPRGPDSLPTNQLPVARCPHPPLPRCLAPDSYT
ncbi:hypothetical protein E2C01_007033 [Portunus trituberculatus]|uniref:Uncharacterized protein n=1 Tax=Portunus trituberculatus TaxID=210409 RepID=A0A5B7CY30_PORTR|nr:hypothetical protein [Portunus trituberculatus]